MKPGDLVRIKKIVGYDLDLKVGQVGLIIKEMGEFDGQMWLSVLINARVVQLYEGKLEKLEAISETR